MDETAPASQSPLHQALSDLEVGDAIGMIDVLSQGLAICDILETERIEREMQVLVLDSPNETDRTVGEICPGKFELEPGDEPDAGPVRRTSVFGDRMESSSSSSPRNYISMGTSAKTHSLGELIAENHGSSDPGPTNLKKRWRPEARRAQQLENDQEEQNGRIEGLGDRLGMNSPLWTSNRKAPFSSKGLSRYFATVGSTREKRIVALSAWLLTMVGLFVCLSLVTKDFIQSRKEAMVSIIYQLEESVDIPNTYICSRQVAFPAFPDLPTEEFPGEPILWVHSLEMPGNASEPLTYPKTHESDNINFVYIDIFGNPCEDSAGHLADAAQFRSSRQQSPRCFNCVLVKNHPRITIMRSDFENDRRVGSYGASEAASFAIDVSQSLLLHGCRQTTQGLGQTSYFALTKLILDNVDALEARGILDFGNKNPTTREEYFKLFPRLRERREYGYTDFVTADVIDTLCNTAMFSGFFYPIPPGQEVAFVYNSNHERWERKQGTRGPYYPENLDEIYAPVAIDKNGNIEPNQVILPKRGEHSAQLDSFVSDEGVPILSGRWLSVLVESAHGSGAPLSQISAIPGQGTDTIYFTKQSNGEALIYNTENDPLHGYVVDGNNANTHISLRLTCKDFLTRQVSSQVTVQVTSFLADFFGLVELFLDLSVYTLIISPLVVSMRRRAVINRMRNIQNAASVSPV